MRLDKSTTWTRCWVFTVTLQLGALNKEAWEVISSIQSMLNRRAPINRIPCDVLVLLPDFCGSHWRKKVAITLTHVCRAWREIFISRASLWTDFHCIDAEKTRVCIERSKSAPINMWLERKRGLLPNDPFLNIPTHAIGRLKSLCIRTTRDHFEDITKYFVHPTPLIEALVVDGGDALNHLPTPVLPSALFDGDLSSLRELCLQSVSTQLPWRNMNNLTSLILAFVSRPTVSLGQILDFFESAPRLLEVVLTAAAPTLGAQDGRLVSLSHLRKLKITGPQPPSLLLGHLVIPVGAEATISHDSLQSQIDDVLPRSLDNFRNLSNFSRIEFEFESFNTCMRFTGPNGEFSVTSRLGLDPTHSVIRVLERLDTSSAECLDIEDDDCMTDELHEAISSMPNLCTLHIARENDSPSFLCGLHRSLAQDGMIACPKLEELTYSVRGEFDLEILVEFAASRVASGVPLKSVEVFSGEPAPRREVAELREYVSRVDISFDGEECGRNREDIYEDEDSFEDEDSYEDEDSDLEDWGSYW